MIKIITTIALGTLTITSAYALTENPKDNYGMPRGFSVLTPEEIQVDVVLNGYVGSSEYGEYKGAVLEPVLITCLNGAPGYYYVFTYRGTDEHKKRAMEGMIQLLNDERGFLWEEILPFLNIVRDNSKEYCTFTYAAWDFGECRSKSTGTDSLLYELEIYVEITKKRLGVKGNPKIKLYADAPFRSGIIFGVKGNGSDERYLWLVGHSGWVLDENRRVKTYVGFAEPTEEEITDCYEEKIENLRSSIKAKGAIFEENMRRWAETRDKVGAIRKEDGYYRIMVHEYGQ
jgi:hypothetical protein